MGEFGPVVIVGSTIEEPDGDAFLKGSRARNITNVAIMIMATPRHMRISLKKFLILSKEIFISPYLYSDKL